MVKEEIKEIGHEYIVYGLRRSGNHAIINWILPQVKGDFSYYNDVWPNAPYKGKPKQRRGNGSKVDTSIISFEDYNLQIFKSLLRNRSQPKVQKRTTILIIRDPFNWYASRLKSDMSQPAHYSGLNLRQLYLQYIREYNRESIFLEGHVVLISYNQWKSDLSYRKSISKGLGLEFTDDGLNKVTGEGGGSSFDGMIVSGQQLRTDKRYLYYLNDDTFLSLFTNKELLFFCESEFLIPEELLFLKDKVKRKNTDLLDSIVLNTVPKWTHFLRQTYLTFKK